MVNVFTGAEKGFLGGNLKKEINGWNVDYGNIFIDNFYLPSKIDNIFHFAGPSDDYDFMDETKTIKTIINGTINVLNLAKKNNSKFIFASTLGVETPTENVYCTSKFLMEKYIKNNYNNWVILRIPRVYDKTRNKGLMKKIRLNDIPDKDLDKKIKFITLNSFINQTLDVVKQQNIIYNYNNLKCETIANIKKLYT
jgi:nucleoside-diphosphate-sugar epimerase